MFGLPLASSNAACPYQLGMSSPDVRSIFPEGWRVLRSLSLGCSPQVAVCLECGAARFKVPETELKLVRENL